MSDLEEKKPDANKLLTCNLEFEVHDDDSPDLSGCVDHKPSTEQTTGVKRSLILDSSDDEEFTEMLLCGVSDENESTLLQDGQNIEQTSSNPNFLLDSSDDKKPLSCESQNLLKDSQNPEQASSVSPALLLDSSDDEELSKELVRSASGERRSQRASAKHNPKLLSCCICKKEFVHNRDLLIHYTTHKNNSKSCNICGKSFANMVLLSRHSTVHFDKDVKSSFVCKQCDCTFLQKQDFISHMLFFKHGENRIFKCDHCGGFFVNESDLKAHLATHSAQRRKVIGCEECGKTFKKRLELRNHMVKHIGEKSYECEVCKLTFKSKFVLSKHREVIHASKLVCSVCNLSFSKKDKKNYDFHVKLHSN